MPHSSYGCYLHTYPSPALPSHPLPFLSFPSHELVVVILLEDLPQVVEYIGGEQVRSCIHNAAHKSAWLLHIVQHLCMHINGTCMHASTVTFAVYTVNRLLIQSDELEVYPFSTIGWSELYTQLCT